MTRIPVAGVTVPEESAVEESVPEEATPEEAAPEAVAEVVEIPRQQSVDTAADTSLLPDTDSGTGEAAHR
ncbi:hypothetical protein [Streptomyces sp. CC208A]|uniref:hypothetical protein n=1 Tax=Streptomyces sp. CC208A TaxID=3044573 RepID=UPI0024A90E79|nr:hypothetical protein [Streptomyces sp. CC208A]